MKPQSTSGSTRQSDEQRRPCIDRTLVAIERLENARSAAAPGREQKWLSEVRFALAELCDAINLHTENADDPKSALSEIERVEPRLASQVAVLRERYRDLKHACDTLRNELEPSRTIETLDWAGIRRRVTELLTEARDYWAGENDLFFAAYDDDVGVGD